MAVNIVGFSKQWLIKDAPHAQLSGEHRDFLTATEEARNTLVRSFAPLSKDVLILDKAQAGLYSQSFDVLTAFASAAAEPQRAYSMYTQVLYRILDMGLYSTSKDVLMKLDRVPSIFAKYTQTLNAVTQALPVQPMSQVISFETVNQAVSLVTQTSPDMPFIWSQTGVTQETVQVVQARPITTLSYESVSQAELLVVGRFDYATPAEMVGAEVVGQGVMLICQSLDIPYTPVSGLFACQQVVMVAQQVTGMSMWRSPATVPQLQMRVVQKLNKEALPRSSTVVSEQLSQVVQALPMSVPLGPEITGQMASQVVQETVMPEPVGVEMATQQTTLVAQAADMPQPVGMEHAAQAVSLVAQQVEAGKVISYMRVPQELAQVVQARPEDLPLSRTRVAQQAGLVTQHADYTVPADMLARSRARTVRNLVAQQATYASASSPSTTSYAQFRTVFTLGADPAWYPPPNVVYERSRFVFDNQFMEMVPQAFPMPLPLSPTRTSQFTILTSAHIDMAKPSDMANSGLFLQQISDHVTYSVSYPTTGVPASDSVVLQAQQHVVVESHYPDAFLPTNYSVVPQINAQIAQEMSYDAAESLHSPVIAAYVSKQLTLFSGFPEPGSLQSPLSTLQITGQLSVSATYPLKDTVLSSGRVTQLVRQTAVSALYPDKNVPQATERVEQVRQHIVTRDTSMYQLPELPRRHRIRISVGFVYD